jgi:hypothetical protein
MRWWIMRLPTSFIGQIREGRRYRRGEMVDGLWGYSMLPFWEEEREGKCPFRKGKGAYEAALGSRVEG